jgi:hypothetical protein
MPKNLQLFIQRVDFDNEYVKMLEPEINEFLSSDECPYKGPPHPNHTRSESTRPPNRGQALLNRRTAFLVGLTISSFISHEKCHEIAGAERGGNNPPGIVAPIG